MKKGLQDFLLNELKMHKLQFLQFAVNDYPTFEDQLDQLSMAERTRVNHIPNFVNVVLQQATHQSRYLAWRKPKTLGHRTVPLQKNPVLQYLQYYVLHMLVLITFLMLNNILKS